MCTFGGVRRGSIGESEQSAGACPREEHLRQPLELLVGREQPPATHNVSTNRVNTMLFSAPEMALIAGPAGPQFLSIRAALLRVP